MEYQTNTRSADVLSRFRNAVSELETFVDYNKLEDNSVDVQLHTWLDGNEQPIDWADAEHVTPDEWFFITTLYGEMTVSGQRTHIRKYFPRLFVQAAYRNIRNFIPDMAGYSGLRSYWMSQRLCRMSEILRNQNITMSDYTVLLSKIERRASPDNPTPALDRIVRDHRASGWKTLSVFVRDCVGGNCFPIDSRVGKELQRHNLPVDERQLVSLSLTIERNPRQLARMFYEAGGQR